MNPPQFSAEDVRADRGCGDVYFQLHQTVGTNNDPMLIRAFLENCGFPYPEVEMLQIGRDDAKRHLVDLLSSDQAYQTMVMPTERAHDYAEQFIGAFGEDGRFYTNTEKYRSGLEAFSPLTEATFDSGVIGVDGRRIGIIWFDDED